MYKQYLNSTPSCDLLTACNLPKIARRIKIHQFKRYYYITTVTTFQICIRKKLLSMYSCIYENSKNTFETNSSVVHVFLWYWYTRYECFIFSLRVWWISDIMENVSLFSAVFQIQQYSWIFILNCNQLFVSNHLLCNLKGIVNVIEPWCADKVLINHQSIYYSIIQSKYNLEKKLKILKQLVWTFTHEVFKKNITLVFICIIFATLKMLIDLKVKNLTCKQESVFCKIQHESLQLVASIISWL